MYGLMARMHGTNNLPDSSNMCHEPTSVGLKSSIGSPVGTTILEDFEATDLILFFGQNVGSNAPRMLHPLQEARRRRVPIITFNPAARAGPGALHEPAIAHRDADADLHGDLDAVPSGQGRRRHRRHHRHVQGAHRRRPRGDGGGAPPGPRRRLHRRAHPRLPRVRGLLRRAGLARHRNPLGSDPRGHRGRCHRLCARPPPSWPSTAWA